MLPYLEAKQEDNPTRVKNEKFRSHAKNKDQSPPHSIPGSNCPQGRR